MVAGPSCVYEHQANSCIACPHFSPLFYFALDARVHCPYIPVSYTEKPADRAHCLDGVVPVQVLEELVHLHEVPRLMQEFRTLNKIHNDFVVPLDRRARRSSFGSPSTVRFLPLFHLCSMDNRVPANLEKLLVSARQ